MVVHAARALREGGCAGIVVAAPAAYLSDVSALLPGADVTVVAGGRTRQESVQAALRAVPDDAEWVLIHDAARPLVPLEVFGRVLAALAGGAPAVIPVLPVTDTIKSVDDAGLVTSTVDRAGLCRAQTPQGFQRNLLVRALEHSAREGHEITDDAAAVAALGVQVLTVPGDERGLKITTAGDLVIAEAQDGADRLG